METHELEVKKEMCPLRDFDPYCNQRTVHWKNLLMMNFYSEVFNC